MTTTRPWSIQWQQVLVKKVAISQWKPFLLPLAWQVRGNSKANPGNSCYQTSPVSGALTASTNQRFQPLGHVISEHAKNCWQTKPMKYLVLRWRSYTRRIGIKHFEKGLNCHCKKITIIKRSPFVSRYDSELTLDSTASSTSYRGNFALSHSFEPYCSSI